MVSKTIIKYLLIAGGAVAGGYVLLKAAEKTIAGIPDIFAPLTAPVEGIVTAWEDLTKPLPQPLRTWEPVPEARPILTEATEVIPGTDFPVSPQRLAYQEAIGVPIVTAEQYAAMQAAAIAPEAVPEAAPPLATLITAPGYQAGLQKQYAAIAAAQQMASGQFWVNPVTGAQMLPYVAGEPTPPSVLRLREQDIYPAIRGF